MGENYGWLSVLPPFIAIGLAVTTRRVLISLSLGVLSGALIYTNGSLSAALFHCFETFLWPSLVDESHLRVFAFTLLMGAMVGIIGRSGGLSQVVELLMQLANSRLSVQLVTWAMGLIIFFDDYANTLLLGTTMRPLCDRLKVSREKLAYIVDSTAAPVAGLAIVSTWVAGEIDYIETGLAGLQFAGAAPNGFELFVTTIPYRFYVLFALLMVPLVAITRRDFRAMLQCERRANLETTVIETQHHKAADAADPPARWYDAMIPILVMVIGVLYLLIQTGKQAIADQPDHQVTWMAIFGAADAYVALVYGSLSGLVVALFMVTVRGRLSVRQAQDAAFEGAVLMLPALAILWLAWSLSLVTSTEFLGTGTELGNLLNQAVSPAWLPTIVFLLSGGVAFCTGTSWGTMGILMPLVIQTAHKLILSEAGAVAVNDPILTATIGSVLAGAIFGDHCSPISDTTVLSAQASGCSHIEHVRTQMPYAITAGAVAIVCGTIPVGFGVPVWIALPLGGIGILIALYSLGSPLAAEQSEPVADH